MSKLILVIEDDPATARLVDYSLRHHDFDVITANEGMDGIQKAHKKKPDLVILDVMLPGIDGFEICRRLRADKYTAEIPIIIFSAKTQESDQATGREAGADDYLTKPAAPAEIVARVEKLLAKKETGTLPKKNAENKGRIRE